MALSPRQDDRWTAFFVRRSGACADVFPLAGEEQAEKEEGREDAEQRND
jgi:hypothetical protein